MRRSTPASASAAQSASRARNVAATITTACVSLFAVGLATAYLAAPTRTALAIDIRVDAATVVASSKIVIYGKATDYRSKAIKGLAVSVRRSGKLKLTLKSHADGTFRTASSLAAGTYVVSVTTKVKGKTRTARASVKLKRGRAYRITIRLIRNGGLSILPVRSY